MSVMSSSTLNVTHVFPLSLYEECAKYIASIVIYTAYTIANIFLLPVYILILYMGFQRWRHQPSAPARQSTSHSDFFTFHLITVEILCLFASLVTCLGIYIFSVTLLRLGMLVSGITFPGQTLFHCLTCVERYLAVVHPITYMRLRETGGVRVRNISIACVWLLCFGWVGLTGLYLPEFPVIPLLYMMGISVIIILLCCLSVLRVLTRSGPGDVGGNKERVDQSKQRAFHIICAIMVTLLLRFFGLLLGFGLSNVPSIHREHLCAFMDTGILLTLPSSLVLPLLFLHKTGKLACCRQST